MRINVAIRISTARPCVPIIRDHIENLTKILTAYKIYGLIHLLSVGFELETHNHISEINVYFDKKSSTCYFPSSIM